MKRVLVYIIIGIFFLTITYILLREVSPFNNEIISELIESEEIVDGDFNKLNDEINNLISRGLILSYLSDNAYIIIFTFFSGLFFIFMGIHLIIDKLFFKNFYEKASIFDAMRRGFLLIITLGFIIYLKLTRAETYLIILIPVAAVLIETVYVMYFKKQKAIDENLEEESEPALKDIEEQVGRHIDTIEDIDRFPSKDKSI